ncbi:hypothetical protein Tco_1530477 [Tanacetum coccineum]
MIIEFKVDGISSKLVWEMLGLKNEEIDVLDSMPNRNDEMDADMNFKLNFIVLFTSLMGNIKQKGVSELLSKKEVEELNSGGFGHGEIEEAFFDEEEDLIPNNIEGCVWMLKYVNNITKEQIGFERILAETENMFLGNINLNGFVERYIDTLKYLSCGNTSSTNANMHKTQEREQDVQGEDGCSSSVN